MPEDFSPDLSDADLHLNVTPLVAGEDVEALQCYLDAHRLAPLTDLAKALSTALAELDPEQLIASGAPADEYDPEARHLTALHLEGVRIDSRVVQRVWEHYFGSQGPRDWQRIADATTRTLNTGLN